MTANRPSDPNRLGRHVRRLDNLILAVGGLAGAGLALLIAGGWWGGGWADAVLVAGWLVTIFVAVPLTAWGAWLLVTGTAKDLADMARTLWTDVRAGLPRAAKRGTGR